MKTIHFRGDPRRSFDARLELKPIAAADRPRFDRANTPSSFCSAEELLFPFPGNWESVFGIVSSFFSFFWRRKLIKTEEIN